ncbi:MAG: ABC transporter permease [Acidobacteria bacterium]|nr:ABC transporter permease [Acidobacteriota bacterium]
MESLSHDIRFGARLLWKDKAFTLTALLTLLLSIGANAALFSVVNSILLRPLPLPESDRILLMYNSYPNAGAPYGSSGVPDYYDRLESVRTLEEQALYQFGGFTIGGRETPERLRGIAVTPSFFRLIRIKPQLGRTFTAAEGEIGHERKIVLTDALWQRLFARNPSVIGRDLRINGNPYTVVGVMPRDFLFLDPDVRLFVPLAFTAAQKSDEARHSNSWTNIGRSRRGATLEQTQAQIDALNAANLERFPEFKQILINAGFHTKVVRLQDDVVREVRGTLYLLWGGACFVLLIGCVNVANLMLVRSRVRLKELATRVSLGAGRVRIIRQLLTESVLLTTIGAALGLLLGYAALRTLNRFDIEDIPRGAEIQLDAIAVIYTLSVAASVGVLIGLIPLAAILRANLSSVLREESRTGTGGRGARALRRTLVVAQVAFAFVLLLGAGLLAASFRHVLAVDPGFRSQGVLTAAVSAPPARYNGDDELRVLATESLRRIRALPGVMAAGTTSSIPFGGSYSDSVILAEGHQMKPGESLISPAQLRVSPGYFEAMGARLVSGRFFTEADTKDARRVLIIDDRLARRFWPGQDAVGKRMYQPNDAKDLVATNEKTEWLTVVGVVREMKLRGFVESTESVGAYFFPYAQSPTRRLTFAIRTATRPTAIVSALRREIAQIDSELPVYDVFTMDDRAAKSLVTRRWPLLLAGAFAVIALFLSSIGIYGVLAYLVAERRKEIGIRMALGGTPRRIFELVLSEGMILLAGGFVLGIAGSIALRKSLASQLYGVTPLDPTVVLLATAVLAVVALIACTVPATRATRIDPVGALNAE